MYLSIIIIIILEKTTNLLQYSNIYTTVFQD